MKTVYTLFGTHTGKTSNFNEPYINEEGTQESNEFMREKILRLKKDHCTVGCIEKLKNGLFNMPDSNFYGT